VRDSEYDCELHRTRVTGSSPSDGIGTTGTDEPLRLTTHVTCLPVSAAGRAPGPPGRASIEPGPVAIADVRMRVVLGAYESLDAVDALARRLLSRGIV
jgi:hypothetical protein